MMFRRTAILLLLLTWTASAAVAGSSADRKRGDRCYTVRVDAVKRSEARERRRQYRRRFSAQEVLDLRLSVWLPAKSDASLVEVKLYTPNGRLYDVVRASAGPDASDQRPRFRRRRARVVSARLPVAGSHITSRSLYGKWRADVFLDGSDRRCVRPKRFFIDP